MSISTPHPKRLRGNMHVTPVVHPRRGITPPFKPAGERRQGACARLVQRQTPTNADLGVTLQTTAAEHARFIHPPPPERNRIEAKRSREEKGDGRRKNGEKRRVRKGGVKREK
ncbi:hypothetical protein C8R44DRAFT_749285 [Mycena epipterygia]|nr:hypothetical protein C8R44DRAFT_749285 [Mycena epipterygia]